MMDLQFPLVNVQTGETEIPGYIDAGNVISWNVWKIPGDQNPGQGIDRKMRGKALVVINMNNGIGLSHVTTDSFDSVSARLLEARGQKDRAQIHATAHAADQLKKSPLAVV